METTTVQIDVLELATGVILRRENRDSWSPLVEGDGNENEQESRSSICRALFPSNERLMSEVQAPVYQEGISRFKKPMDADQGQTPSQKIKEIRTTIWVSSSGQEYSCCWQTPQ
jgi:hypothetical protein